ncbi:transposase [Proteiniclasticum sp. QWL-01]|uniref:transposase n=1 Tax=Proteiniclasticum sp. QWL-01 TaxID=3036945 RepID=UPI002410314A|nr:transposase [Proteiniclasticum sp. QWL-01]WFF71788.1 transposase [Proteiniclasticum sp. QWL-01]
MEQTGAGFFERIEDCQAYRNGYRDRTMKTRVGTLTLTVQRLRDGSFILEPSTRYQCNEQALVLAMMEMGSTAYLLGRSPKSPKSCSVSPSPRPPYPLCARSLPL